MIVRSIIAAVLLRVLVVLLSDVEVLQDRVEITTPVNNVRQIREAVQLLRWNVSPYTSSSVHTQPLVIAALSPVASSKYGLAALNIILDVIGAGFLASIGEGTSRATIFACYALNPLAILSSASGSLSSLENCLICMALLGGAKRHPVLAALGLCGAAYLSFHSWLLLVPSALLICNGPEELMPHWKAHKSMWTFLACTLLFSSWLALLSDVALRNFPQHQCLPIIVPAARKWLGNLSPAQQHNWTAGTTSSSSEASGFPGVGDCWATASYGFVWEVVDTTPNIGLFWYFFTEMFTHFAPFFRFVFHSQAAVMVAPLAIRFPHRPLLLCFCALLLRSIFKPYPSIADLVSYIALLPAFAPQLARMQWGLLLINSFVLLAVLGPAMFHAWIVVGSANSNFFYSITLLLAAWQIMLLVHMLTLTVDLDRDLDRESINDKAAGVHLAGTSASAETQHDEAHTKAGSETVSN